MSKNTQNPLKNKLKLIANKSNWEILNPKEIFKGINENTGIFNLDFILIKIVKTTEYRKNLIIIPVKIWRGTGYFRYNSGSINYSSSKGKISNSLRKRAISEGLYPLKNSRNELARSFLKYSNIAKRIFNHLDLHIEARIEPKHVYYILDGHKLSISIKPLSLSQNGGRFIPEDNMTLKIPEISGFSRIINSNFGYYPVLFNYFVTIKSTKKFLKYIVARIVAIESMKSPRKNKDSFPDFTNLNLGFGIITILLGIFSILSFFVFPKFISDLVVSISIIMFLAVFCAYFYMIRKEKREYMAVKINPTVPLVNKHGIIPPIHFSKFKSTIENFTNSLYAAEFISEHILVWFRLKKGMKKSLIEKIALLINQIDEYYTENIDQNYYAQIISGKTSIDNLNANIIQKKYESAYESRNFTTASEFLIISLMKMVRSALINRNILQPNDLINLLNVSDILQSPIVFSDNFNPLLSRLSEWESRIYHNLSVEEQECTNYLKLSKSILKLLSLRFKPKKSESQKKALKNNIFYDERFYNEFIGENRNRNLSHALTGIKKKMTESRMKLKNYKLTSMNKS